MRTIAVDDPVAWASVSLSVCRVGDCSPDVVTMWLLLVYFAADLWPVRTNVQTDTLYQ